MELYYEPMLNNLMPLTHASLVCWMGGGLRISMVFILTSQMLDGSGLKDQHGFYTDMPKLLIILHKF